MLVLAKRLLALGAPLLAAALGASVDRLAPLPEPVEAFVDALVRLLELCASN